MKRDKTFTKFVLKIIRLCKFISCTMDSRCIVLICRVDHLRHKLTYQQLTRSLAQPCISYNLVNSYVLTLLLSNEETKANPEVFDK